ncbi:hypothetical protein GCM10008941_18990 [Rhizomicrobium palustre]
MTDNSDLKELARKLVSTFHLSMPERAAFGADPVPGSLLRSAILSVLIERGTFPPKWGRDAPYDGGLIEANPDGSCSITWKAESGVMRSEVIGVQNFASPTEAVVAYAERFFGSSIDGMPVDWRA